MKIAKQIEQLINYTYMHLTQLFIHQKYDCLHKKKLNGYDYQ